MKRCTECRRDYYDETLTYCLDDGTALLDGPGPVDPVHLSESPTRIQTHTTEPTEFFSTRELSNINATLERPRGSVFKSVAVLGAIIAVGLAGYFGYRYATHSKPIASIAVMPFVNASGNADAEYLSDG